jgi:uncharacterized protein (TIGR03437 family)
MAPDRFIERRAILFRIRGPDLFRQSVLGSTLTLKMNSSLIQMFLAVVFVGQVVCATTPPALQISTETAPAGGWAQIKIYAVKPAVIASGHLVLNLDATAFGTGAMVGLFGANGDATGLATVNGPLIDIQFSSATGGIGQLAGLPVLVVSVPVLASAARRAVVVSATSPDSSVSVASGAVTVQGTLSVQKIPAGMGVVAAGTVVPVYGTGFTASTTVIIDGVLIASTKFISAQEIDVNLGGATELVGKRARVTEGSAEFDFFCIQPSDPVSFPGTPATVQPLFPLFASTGFVGTFSDFGTAVEVQNPNPAPAMVSSTLVSTDGNQTLSQDTIPVPAGSSTTFQGNFHFDLFVSSDRPVRAGGMNFYCGGPPPSVCLNFPDAYDSVAQSPLPLVLTPSSLAFAYQRGSATPPSARTVLINFARFGAIKVAATTASGQSWLTAAISAAGPSANFTVSINPSQLAVGTYEGSVLVTQDRGSSATLPVSLTVTDTPVPLISAAPTSLSFSAPAFNAVSYTQAITLTSDSGPAAFSVSLEPGTWLKVSPTSGTTPSTLMVTWDPAVTSQFYYGQRSTSGSILINGPGNANTVPAVFNVTGVRTFETSLVFSAQTGSPPQMQFIGVDPPGVIAATADQPWMTVAVPTMGPNANQAVTVTVDPAGLADGVYHGTVTIGEEGLASIAVPVTLGVWSSPPPLTITQSAFTFVQTVGQAVPVYQMAEVDSGGVPLPLTILKGANWLNVVYGTLTPAAIRVGVLNPFPPFSPGEYDGSFTIQSPGNSIYVPVTLLVEPGPVAPPVLSQVVNAASGIAGAVSPGEILTIRGYGAGASQVGSLKLDASGMVGSSLNGLEVTFDGKPAPLLYTSANQTNLIVPYEVAGKASTLMQVVYETAAGRLQTAGWVLPVAPSAPGVFTLDATGTGPGAVLNQDNSVNGIANPASRRSVISIYVTGEGQTRPAGVTGSVTQSNTTAPSLPVTVKIGGIEATVQYAGSAPDQVAGLLQVNAVVPQGVTPGPAVPVTVSVGGIPSQAGVTIAVQ